MFLSTKAVDTQSDSYFLIPAEKAANPPAGWSVISEDEAKNVWGKGVAGQRFPNVTGPDAPHSCMNSHLCYPECDKKGMAKASALSMNATLNIQDTPLSYSPPVGPNMDFHLNYAHLEAAQPTTFTFTNLGQNWTFNWLSYLTVDPTSSVATVRIRGGGSEVFTPNGTTGLYPPDFMSQATLVSMGGGVYQRQLADGAIEVFNQADTSSPPRIFCTSVVDPQGNSVSIQYDANFRITTITDAIGQVSTLAYLSNTVGNAGFYKVSTVTDPFGRSCSFGYDATTTNLTSITDVVNLKSQFVYDTSSTFISQMTTPYGTTSFYNYSPGTTGIYPALGLRFTFPDGTSSVIENWIDETKTTYFWDRHATQLYPADPANKVYTHCEQMKWTIAAPTAYEAPTMQWQTHPLESQSPIYFTYAGVTNPDYTGTSNQPLSITRSLGNPVVTATIGGTITPGDIVYLGVEGQYIANYTVQAGDTTTSIAASLANIINTNSTLQNLTVVATAIGPAVTLHSDLSYVYSYPGVVSPGATETIKVLSPTRQSANATMTGTLTVGDVIRVYLSTPYPHTGSGQQYFHTVTGTDTYNSILTDLATQMNADPVAQAFQALASVSGATINFVSYNPNTELWQTGVSSGSGSESFLLANVRTNSTQTTEYQRNALSKPTQVIDPLGRKFSWSYATNNIDLLEKREIQGADNFLMGHWEYNSFHNPTIYIDGSGQQTHYTYNALQQPLTVVDANSNTTTLTYTGTSKATIGGTITVGNVLTITVHDAGLTGGQKAISYTVASGDTTTKIATGLKNAINADTSLQGIGVTATSSAAVVTLLSTSVNVTTYTQSTSGGATETITLGANTYGYLTKIDGPLAGNKDVTTFSYDGFGRLFTVTDSEGYTLTFSYDNMNRPTVTTYPDGTTEKTTWDKLDAVLRTDRIGRCTQSSFDSMDQKSFEIDPLGRKTQYLWCTCGSLASLTDPNNNTTSWHHDIEGRLTSKIYPDASTVSYTYEPFAGWLRARTDALSQTTRYYFNPDNTQYQVGYSGAINPTGGLTYNWDLFFKRLISMNKSDWGTYSYTYNPYITNAYGTPTTGGGMIQLVHNNVIANSDTTYLYDALGRTTNRSINGSANSDTWTYDAMSRVTAESNTLGNFSYAYVDDATGSSKGTTRLASIGYPNAQTTKYDWYPTIKDERLQQIRNLGPTGATISQFGYVYDAAGQITQWQQIQNNRSLGYSLGYDQAGQLITVQASPGNQSAAYLKQWYYCYDPGSNLTGVQTNTVTRASIGGSVTAGNILTITVSDTGLTGGQKAVSYTVLVGDTLSTIANGLAAALTADSSLQGIGVNASANGPVISIKSASPNLTTYAQSVSGGSSETISLGVTRNFVESATIGGTKTTGNTLTINVIDPALTGGQKAITYTVLAADTLTTIATGLKTAIDADSSLSALGVSATSAGTTITIKSNSTNATTYSQSTSSGATETITLAINQNVPQTAAVGGSKTTGDIITLTVYDAALTGGLQAVTYTVLSTDTLASIASGIATAVNANTNLQAIGLSASSSGQVVTLLSNSLNPTTYRATTSTSATETVFLNIPVNGIQTAVVGGMKTTGDTITVTVYDAALTGGSKADTYTVLPGDTLNSIASGIAAMLNSDSSLAAIGVTASAISTVVNISSASINATTYAKSTGVGATETLTLTPATAATQYRYNNLNELTSIAAGGATRVQAFANKALKSATVNSLPANLNWSENFSGNANLSSGGNSVTISATDGASNVKTNSYQVSAYGPSSATPTFDANGNLTSDGMNSYSWDAANRLVKITYSGSGNYSQFTYDHQSELVKIVETVGGLITNTKLFVKCGSAKCEERNASSAIAKQFFGLGQTISGTNYYYTRDLSGTICNMTDSAAVNQAQYQYDPYGRVTQTAGALAADFQYAGYYVHSPSGLNLATYRAYSPSLGRWINRDMIGENGGVNLYGYGANCPVSVVDPSGLTPYNENGALIYKDLGEFKSAAGLEGSANIGGGCIDVVNNGIKNKLGTLPEKAPNTHCFFGMVDLRKYKCDCGRPVMWRKFGDWDPRYPQPGFGGEIKDPGGVWLGSEGGQFDYRLISNGMQWGMNHGFNGMFGSQGSAAGVGYPIGADSQYGTAMTCVTCVK